MNSSNYTDITTSVVNVTEGNFVQKVAEFKAKLNTMVSEVNAAFEKGDVWSGESAKQFKETFDKNVDAWYSYIAALDRLPGILGMVSTTAKSFEQETFNG